MTDTDNDNNTIDQSFTDDDNDTISEVGKKRKYEVLTNLFAEDVLNQTKTAVKVISKLNQGRNQSNERTLMALKKKNEEIEELPKEMETKDLSILSENSLRIVGTIMNTQTHYEKLADDLYQSMVNDGFIDESIYYTKQNFMADKKLKSALSKVFASYLPEKFEDSNPNYSYKKLRLSESYIYFRCTETYLNEARRQQEKSIEYGTIIDEQHVYSADDILNVIKIRKRLIQRVNRIVNNVMSLFPFPDDEPKAPKRMPIEKSQKEVHRQSLNRNMNEGQKLKKEMLRKIDLVMNDSLTKQEIKDEFERMKGYDVDKFNSLLEMKPEFDDAVDKANERLRWDELDYFRENNGNVDELISLVENNEYVKKKHPSVVKTIRKIRDNDKQNGTNLFFDKICKKKVNHAVIIDVLREHNGVEDDDDDSDYEDDDDDDGDEENHGEDNNDDNCEEEDDEEDDEDEDEDEDDPESEDPDETELNCWQKLNDLLTEWNADRKTNQVTTVVNVGETSVDLPFEKQDNFLNGKDYDNINLFLCTDISKIDLFADAVTRNPHAHAVIRVPLDMLSDRRLISLKQLRIAICVDMNFAFVLYNIALKGHGHVNIIDPDSQDIKRECSSLHVLDKKPIEKVVNI
jgi:hypothetical protein